MPVLLVSSALISNLAPYLSISKYEYLQSVCGKYSHLMLSFLPQDIIVHILDALDTQYTSGTGEHSDVWHPGRVLTLQNITLASRTLCAFARPRLFAHIDFDAGRDVQDRASRLLRYFSPEDTEVASANPRPDDTKQRRLDSIRSLRLRDGRRASRIDVRQTPWEPDRATPLGRLLTLFVNAPHLRMFAFEGDLWTLAGAGELVGYQDYIHAMSSKPSLRVLSLANAYDVPIDVFFMMHGHQQFATGVRSLQISNVSFISRSEVGGGTTLATPHPIKHLKLGRLNYTHLFGMLQRQCTEMESHPRGSTYGGASPLFYQLKSLSLALSVVPAQAAALWNLVYGLRETLEHLQIRNYESVSDKLRLNTLELADAWSLGFKQSLEKFARLDTLTLSTQILASSTQRLDSAAKLCWGLHLLVDLLGTFIDCPTPNLRQLNLEIFFMGEEMSDQAQTSEPAQTISLAQGPIDPVWRRLDSHLTSVIQATPSVTISIILLPFFFIKHGNVAIAEGSPGYKRYLSRGKGDEFGMKVCLPNVFANAQVDIRVDPVLSNQDMPTYLRSA